MVKTECLHVFLEIMNEVRISSLTSSMQHCPIGPSWCSRQENRNKKPTDRKGRSKTVSLITDDIIIYIENPRSLQKKPTRTK